MPCSVRRATPEELDAVAELGRERDILGRDGLDPLDMHTREIDLDAEGERDKKRELVRGIDAADIEGRIGFGVAALLRLLQDIGERPSGRAHLGQDEIAGAVQDAVEPVDAVADKGLADRLDDGDAAGDRRLEIERDMFGFRDPREGHAMARQKRLVGGDDRLAVFEGARHEGARRVALPAHQLDDDVDIGSARERDGVGLEARGDLAPAVLRRGRAR